MLQTDMRVMFVYPEDQPIPPVDPKDYGTVSLILYYAHTWGDFLKSKTFDSLRPLLSRDFLYILINQEGQTK